MRTRFRTIVVMVLVTALLIPAIGANATPPDIEQFTDSSVSVQKDACGEGIDIIYSFELLIVEQTFFDQDGAVERVRTLEQGPVLVERSDTSKTYDSRIDASFVVDLANQTLTSTGAVFADHLPGEGLIAQDVGRVVFDGFGPPDPIVFLAGKHDVLLGDVNVLEVYCDILA